MVLYPESVIKYFSLLRTGEVGSDISFELQQIADFRECLTKPRESRMEGKNEGNKEINLQIGF